MTLALDEISLLKESLLYLDPTNKVLSEEKYALLGRLAKAYQACVHFLMSDVIMRADKETEQVVMLVVEFKALVGYLYDSLIPYNTIYSLCDLYYTALFMGCGQGWGIVMFSACKALVPNFYDIF